MATKIEHGVEFRHSTRNALQFWAENGEWSVLTLGSLCFPWWVRDTAWCWFDFNLRYILHTPIVNVDYLKLNTKFSIKIDYNFTLNKNNLVLRYSHLKSRIEWCNSRSALRYYQSENMIMIHSPNQNRTHRRRLYSLTHMQQINILI